MSAPALVGVGRPTLRIRGTSYPVLLPTVSDPRLHLAAVIVSLQVLGQAAFDFRVSIAQILISLGTCAGLEIAIALWRQRVIMWPASALITGNGVAFILRLPGTHHGDWLGTRGGWIFAATAAVSLLSKYVIRIRGAHVFNPSNIGLVLCFLVLGSRRVEPLDFWWGPMSVWLALAPAVSVVGGLAILRRLGRLVIAASFWFAFVAALALPAATGHAMVARWHLGAVTGFHFWWVLATSPEILVFLFFMITDPKTTPRPCRARIGYGVSIGLLAALLIAPARTEYWSKVAVLGALAIVCLVRAVAARVKLELPVAGRALLVALVAGLAHYGGALYAAGSRARTPVAVRGSGYDGWLPPITVLSSKGVDAKLDSATARRMLGDLMSRLPAAERSRVDQVTLRLQPGEFQSGPTPVARIDEGGKVRMVELGLRNGKYVITGTR